MSKRNYNVFFNTHTVSGIVVSVALYIIFLAGAFALFKPEIEAWEKGQFYEEVSRKNVDYDFLINKLSEKNYLKSRDLKFYLEGDTEEINLLISPVIDTVDVPKEALNRYFKSIHATTAKPTSYIEGYSYGEFLYRLHFFSQIPRIGIYLAGIVSLLFLFAIVTGVIVHWNKIVQNFYQFNPKSSLKRVWADAHTTLGFIGLPIQFIYALTGAYFGLSILVLVPANFLYNGNQEKLVNDLRPDRKTYEWVSDLEEEMPSVNTFVQNNFNNWEHFEPHYLYIKNFGGTNMRYELVGDLETKERFISSGIVSYDIKSNKIEELLDPNEVNYISDIQKTMNTLHFATFGGKWLKLVYFILALITCFVIVSGVLIWVQARNKKKITLKQRRFSERTGQIYLAISLSLLPVIALFFIVVKLLPLEFSTQKMDILYHSFFWVWLALSVVFYFKRDNYSVNRMSLLLISFFGILIPIVNGIVSGNWIWVAFTEGQDGVLLIDMLWIFISVLSFVIVLKLKPKKYNTSDEMIKVSLKNELIIKKENKMRVLNIAFLWVFIAIGFVLHHIYGLATVFFSESVMIEGSTGDIPMWVHKWRVLMEGLALLFGLLTIEISKKWFQWTSFIWAIVIGLFNIYHLITASIYELSNISEIFILLLIVVANVFLANRLYRWVYNK